MDQESLFGAFGAEPDGQTTFTFPAHFAGWRAAARKALISGLAPDSVGWQAVFDQAPVVTDAGERLPRQFRVPREFLELARAVSCHDTEDRWSLLYIALWRCTHGEPALLDLRGDPVVKALHDRASAVRRDCHKMHAFVRFRRVVDEEGGEEGGERFVAWFEPEHHIVERTADFFRERFSNMRWSILTPRRSAHWEAEGRVWFSEGVDRRLAPESDELEQAWRVYYRSIFNPARVKLDAMRSEMPQKYWRNLPESSEITSLVAASDERLQAMLSTRKSVDTLQCGPLPPAYSQQLDDALRNERQPPLTQLALAVKGCRDCPLWGPATQAVPGSGPATAAIMLVGEQPGDQEDLRGEVFIGPAGTVLDRALAAAGLERDGLYITNAVKHFKFSARGKRRLHQRPAESEVRACEPWLRREIEIVNPMVIVCLGATAARAVLGRPVAVGRERGRPIALTTGAHAIVTNHPAAVLRAGAGNNDPGRAAAGDQLFAGMVADLEMAVAHATAAAATPE